jgi:hypothetical protein
MIAAILLTATAATAADNAVPLQVPRVDTPIKVDGRLDEPFWQQALTISQRERATAMSSAAGTGTVGTYTA